MARAAAWAESRTGEIAIAVVAPGGRRFGHAARRPMRTASLLEALVRPRPCGGAWETASSTVTVE